MKLLTPDVGWAATSKTLFWITHSGMQWKDITPKLDHKEQHVSWGFLPEYVDRLGDHELRRRPRPADRRRVL
ncbi:MAG: hypothetical protein WB762_31455 [Candidatus Sulfotelmatobacter sp.]